MGHGATGGKMSDLREGLFEVKASEQASLGIPALSR